MKNHASAINAYPNQNKDNNADIEKTVEDDISSKKSVVRIGFIVSLVPFFCIFIFDYLMQDGNIYVIDAIWNAFQVAFLDASIIYVGISIIVTMMNDLNDIEGYIGKNNKNTWNRFCTAYIIIFATLFTILTGSDLGVTPRTLNVFFRIIIIVASLVPPYILYKQIYDIRKISE